MGVVGGVEADILDTGPASLGNAGVYGGLGKGVAERWAAESHGEGCVGVAMDGDSRQGVERLNSYC